MLFRHSTSPAVGMAWLHVLVVVVRTPCQPPQPCARTAPCLPDCYTHDDLLERFVAMRDALNATGRPMLYQLCEWVRRPPLQPNRLRDCMDKVHSCPAKPPPSFLWMVGPLAKSP